MIKRLYLITSESIVRVYSYTAMAVALELQ